MPKTSNEELFNAMVAHQIYLLRLSESIRKKIEKLLNETEHEIAANIRDRLRNGTGLNTPADLKRLEAVLKVVKTIRLKKWEEINGAWVKELQELAVYEPTFLANTLTAVVPTVLDTVIPSAKLLRAIATSRPFEGRSLRAWASSIQTEDLRRIEAQIRAGMVQGESSAKIAQRVVGTARLKGTDGTTEITRRAAASITRTAVNFVANEVRAEMLRENADLFDKELYVATLDSRTTAVCRGNDGKIFPVGIGPRPPLHFNCRSLRVPFLDAELLGERPANASTQKQLLRDFSQLHGLGALKSRADIPRGMKTEFDVFSRKRIRELIGRVPAKTTYQEWLKTQSQQFQEDVLGKKRAQLFRKGGLTLDKFVNRVGNEIPLKDLIKLETAAFKKAGISVA